MGEISRLIVAGCVAASLLGACTSNGGGNTDKILSKSEFISHADAICRSYRGRLNGIVADAGSGLTVEQSKKTFDDKLIPLFRGQLAELRLLRPPAADKARIHAYLRDLSLAINAIAVEVRAAKSIPELNAIRVSDLGRAKRAAKAYGMKDC